MEKILIASKNQGKIREVKDRFESTDFEFVGLSSLGDFEEVIEDGATFKENALKKARIRAKETQLITIADDSGLVVEYLEGKPGIYSARFAGDEATDEENNKKLLKELAGVPREKRKAYFKCIIALVIPQGKEYCFSGTCQGFIARKPCGENGFGYDPLFFVPEYNKTMGQLSLVVKNKISHRARALDKLEKFLKDNFGK